MTHKMKLNSQNTTKEADLSESYRLPCRGCTKNCTNYAHCNGKLWRMESNTKKIKIKKT